jgi:hypothetical protein
MIRLDPAVRQSVRTTLLNLGKIRTSEIDQRAFRLEMHSISAPSD